MQVVLIKEAIYNLAADKFTPIPHDVFNALMLGGEDDRSVLQTDDLPRVIMFENKEEYLNYYETDKIDKEKDIYVSKKGQVFCFLKDKNATNTKENTGK